MSVALPDSLNVSHAPVPTNESERLLFRQFYPTLVWVDCQGKVHPGLALAWSADTARRIWTFTLPDSIHPWDTQTEASRNIVDSWGLRLPAIRALGVSAEAIEPDGRLSVTMSDPLDSVPRIFADPALALSHETNPEVWLGGGAGMVRKRPPFWVRYRVETDLDRRDALDRGADLLVTNDPALIEYAAGKPPIRVRPLPWSRTYLLVQPPEAQPLETSVGPDAVRSEARPAQPPFWWREKQECLRAAGAVAPSSGRIVYLRKDAVARGLAERIVALAGGRTDLRAAGLGREDFLAAFAGGAESGYVIAVPRQSLAPCRNLAGWPAGATIQPLIDIRDHVIVRPGAPTLTVDWDGTISLRDGNPAPGNQP